jgi:hypothetical protein
MCTVVNLARDEQGEEQSPLAQWPVSYIYHWLYDPSCFPGERETTDADTGEGRGGAGTSGTLASRLLLCVARSLLAPPLCRVDVARPVSNPCRQLRRRSPARRNA